MDLDEMICRSICQVDSQETRKRLASQIILVGGVAKTDKLVEWLEDQVYLRMREPQFDD
jgi:activator of 2-hydroxyglutaryl-CoA dehydratase